MSIQLLTGLWRRKTFNEVFAISITETAPVTEPVILADVKTPHMRVDFTDDDAYITALIKACRLSLEKFTGLSLVTKQIVWHGSNVRGYSELPYGPIQQVLFIADRDDTILNSDDYELSGIDFLSIVRPYNDLLKVTYTAGYTAVPEDLKLEIKDMVLFAYEHRGDEIKTAYQFSEKAQSYRRICPIF